MRSLDKFSLNTHQNSEDIHLSGKVRNVARFIPAVIWLVLLTYGSLVPAGKLNSGFLSSIPYWDKLVHFASYFGLVGLLLVAVNATPTVNRKVVLTTIFAIIWSLILEGLQLLMEQGRSFEVLDIIANIIGALSGAAAFILLFKGRYYGS